MPNPVSRSLRHLAHRWLTDGPVRIAPFAQIPQPAGEQVRRGVKGPESFTGILRQVPGTPVVYQPATSLLGQKLGYGSKQGRPEHLPSGISPDPVKTLFSLSEAGVAGNTGLVYCRRTRTAVAETSALWETPAAQNPLFATVRFPGARRLAGVSLSLLARSTASFYHFIHDALPRLHLLGDLRPAIDHFLVDAEAKGFAGPWLERVGVPLDRVTWVDNLTHLACDQLLFTNELTFDQQPATWTLHAMRAVIRPPAPHPHRLLWITRRRSYARHLKWEDEILAAFPQFELHDTAGLTPEQQLTLFSEARVIVGPHGAGLSHLAFCAPGTAFVELFPSFPTTPMFGRLCSVAGLRPYWAVLDFEQSGQLPAFRTALADLLAGRL